jgi:hypothetical protein
VYKAIRALEQVGVLSWVNRIKRVREYVPRAVRQPGATTLREPGRRQRFQSLGPWRASPARRRGRQRAEQTAKTAAPATRCNDVARIGHFPRLTRFGNFVTTPRGFMSKREPQIILKTDERKIHLELGLQGKFAAKSSGWDENRVFLEGDKLEIEVKNGRWVLTHLRAKPPEPKPVLHYFPDASDTATAGGNA